MKRVRFGRAAATLSVALVLVLVLGHGNDARATGFLDDVEDGRDAVASSAAAGVPDAAARAAAVQGLVATRSPASAGFTIGAVLAALDADVARGPVTRPRGERTVVEQQVRELLAAQAEAGIGNRALCLLSGRAEPKSLERQVRLVEPRWSCDRH
jgi:hypothetical protein